MKHRLLIIFILSALQIITLSVFSQDTPYDPNRLYPVNQLKADLRFLRARLDSIHPDLYRYTSGKSYSTFFDSLDRIITRPMPEQAFLGLVTLLNEMICDGHTMFLPSEAATEYNNARGRFLPFSIAYINGRLYITENNSTDSSIQPGTTIARINGETTSTIITELLKRQIRDGHNQTYPLWILNHYFAAYYSFAFGQPAQFDLQLVDDKGKSFSKQVAALTKDSIRLLRQQRYSHSISPGTVKGITLEENPVDSFAILTIKSFDADWLKSVHQQDFSSVTDSIFRQLKLHRTRNLLLDLRDNQGGDFETGRYLLSYLIKAPSEYLMGGKESRRLQPAKNNFTGGLFVLVNGGSFSNTAIVSTCLERDQRATFIGEETGGNKFLIYGEPTDITLPYTKIQVYISTTPFRISWQRSDHGIMPGHIVRPGPEDFLTRKDPARILALKLMTNRKSE